MLNVAVFDIFTLLFYFIYLYLKICISILPEFFTIVYFSICIQYPFLFVHFYCIFSIYILYFIICIFLIFITILSFYFYCIFQHLYSMFGHLYLLTSYYYFISLHFYFILAHIYIQYLFHFYSIRLTYLYYIICLFTFLQAISLAKLSRSSSSLDRLTSDRTNTKTN